MSRRTVLAGMVGEGQACGRPLPPSQAQRVRLHSSAVPHLRLPGPRGAFGAALQFGSLPAGPRINVLMVTQGPQQRVGMTQCRLIPPAENKAHHVKHWKCRAGGAPFGYKGWRVTGLSVMVCISQATRTRSSSQSYRSSPDPLLQHEP